MEQINQYINIFFTLKLYQGTRTEHTCVASGSDGRKINSLVNKESEIQNNHENTW